MVTCQNKDLENVYSLKLLGVIELLSIKATYISI